MMAPPSPMIEATLRIAPNLPLQLIQNQVIEEDQSHFRYHSCTDSRRARIDRMPAPSSSPPPRPTSTAALLVILALLFAATSFADATLIIYNSTGVEGNHTVAQARGEKLCSTNGHKVCSFPARAPERTSFILINLFKHNPILLPCQAAILVVAISRRRTI